LAHSLCRLVTAQVYVDFGEVAARNKKLLVIIVADF